MEKMIENKITFYALTIASCCVIGTYDLQSISKSVEAQKAEERCITYNRVENIISVTCEYATFSDIVDQMQTTSSILSSEPPEDGYNKIWLLQAGIKVEKGAALDINSNDVDWLRIVPSQYTPNAISVSGSLKMDSVKVTSWNPSTHDYVHFSEATKYDDLQYALELRPYIKVSSGATGSTEITNSELAYLGYSCSGCGGVSFNGGSGSILKDNQIHHIYKGFYSKGMGYMLIEGNKVYSNEKYGIDPHTGTHHMIIRNNVVYDNGNAGIICSADCSYILIEGNEVYNNGHGENKRGIAVSKNVYDSIIRENVVYNEDKCISIGRDSHDNKIYDNKLSGCLNGVYITKESFNNEIYNNKIQNVDYGLVANSGSNNNVFYSNVIEGAKISDTFEDEDSIGNIFKGSKISFADSIER